MKPGDVVEDRFEVAELAGQGGMGAVFRARDRQTNHVVALKALTDPGGNHVERFLREAQVLHDLHHSGIVRYVAHGRTAAGELYMAMEWVDGESVSQRVARQPFTVPQATFVALQIAQALAESHRHGVVHRDIKPSNVFVHRQSLQVKVLDFGIARLSEAARLTGVGMMLGTPGYMAPEQARGSGNIDARADIFSLGCLYFKCLVGRPPFMSEDVRTVLAQVLFDTAPTVSSLRPGVPASIDALVARMLAKKPPERHADGAAVALELEAIYEALLNPSAARRVSSGSTPQVGRPIPLGVRPIQLTPAAPVAAAPIPLRPIQLTPAPSTIPLITVPQPPIRLQVQVAPAAGPGTEVEFPAARAGSPQTEQEVPIASPRQPTVRLGPAGTEMEVPIAPSTVRLDPPRPVFAPANQVDLPTSMGESPFAPPTEFPADLLDPTPPPSVAVVWESPTFVRSIVELPESPVVVEALASAEAAHLADQLDAVLEAGMRGLASVAGATARGRLLAFQSNARLWRGQHDVAIAASTGALAALPLDRPEWGIAASVQARASGSRGEQDRLEALAQIFIEMDMLDAPPSVFAAATVAMELASSIRPDLAEKVEERIRPASEEDGRPHEVRAAVFQLQGATAGRRGDLSAAVHLSARAATEFRAAGRLLPELAASLEAARWRARLGEFEKADASLGAIRGAAERQGARWLDVEVTLVWGAVAGRMGRHDEALQLGRAALERALPAMGQTLKGRAHALLAELLDLAGRREEAAAEVPKAIALLRVGSQRAGALALQARIALARGHKPEALDLAKQAVAYFDGAPSVFERELESRLTLAKVLFAAGLNDVGRSALTVACDRLKLHTAAISVPEDRSPFLTRLTEHRQLLELAAWWLGRSVE